MRPPALRGLVRQRTTREWLVLGGVTLGVFLLLASFSWREGDVAGDYLVTVALAVAVYALLALGLSVEAGYAGLLNFGHVAFMGVGAYTVAIWGLRMQDTLVPVFEGASPGAGLMTALTALLAGLLAYVVLLQLAQRLPLAPRARILLALVPALLLAAWIAWAIFPVTPRNARSMVALLGILMGVALAALAGLLLGLASLRLREDYLAIVTLGFAEILRLTALNEEWLTQGSQGIQNIHRPLSDWARGTEWWRDLSDRLDVLPVSFAHAAVAVLAVLLAYLLLEALARAPWGRVLKAIREDEEVAAALGKNVLWYKLQALMMGSALAALAGILFIWNLATVLPEHFLAIVTFYAFAMLVLGGIGNHRGALLGAVVLWGILELAGNLTFLEKYDIQFAGPLQGIFVGLVLVLVVLFRPQGAIGDKEEMAHGK